MRRLLVLALALTAMGLSWSFGCAQGTSDGPPDHPDAHVGTSFPDAPNTSFPDAPNSSTPDAFVPPTSDANVSTPDAAGSGSGTGTDGAFCSSDADCNLGAGYCCVQISGVGLCVPGMEPIPGFCVPN